MRPPVTSMRVLVAAIALALVAGACDSSPATTTMPESTTGTTSQSSSTTEAPLSSIPTDQIPG